MASSTTIQLIYTIQKDIAYVGYAVFAIGIIGNIINLLVFTSLKLFRNNQCIFYFISEAISNIIQLFTYFLLRVLTETNVTDPANYILFWCKFRAMVIITCTLISFSAICFAACDQYLATSHQFYLRKMSTIKLARFLILTTICIALLHSIPISIFFEIRGSVCTYYNKGMATYLSYFYYPILTGVLPIFIASLFSILAFRNVRRIVRRQVPIVRRKLDRQLTAMVLVRTMVFVIFTLPYAIQRIYASHANTTPSQPLSYAINNLLTVLVSTIVNLNYAAPFYVFMATSLRYRRQVKFVWIKQFWRQWKLWCSCNPNQVNPNVERRSTGSSVERE